MARHRVKAACMQVMRLPKVCDQGQCGQRPLISRFTTFDFKALYVRDALMR